MEENANVWATHGPSTTDFDVARDPAPPRSKPAQIQVGMIDKPDESVVAGERCVVVDTEITTGRRKRAGPLAVVEQLPTRNTPEQDHAPAPRQDSSEAGQDDVFDESSKFGAEGHA